MMFLCPNCQTKSVKGFSKFKSSDISQAVCSKCGKYSTEPNWTRYIAGLYWGIGIWATALWALFSASWLPLLIPFLVFIAYEILAFLKLPLRPIAEATVRRTRWRLYVFILVMFVVTMVATFTDYLDKYQL